MKCRYKETYEYILVEHILQAEHALKQKLDFKGVPEWVRNAFKTTELRYGKTGDGVTTLEVAQATPLGAIFRTAPCDGYLIALRDEIGVRTRKQFESAYEIID